VLRDNGVHVPQWSVAGLTAGCLGVRLPTVKVQMSRCQSPATTARHRPTDIPGDSSSHVALVVTADAGETPAFRGLVPTACVQVQSAHTTVDSTALRR
jgi:hypothetical protein